MAKFTCKKCNNSTELELYTICEKHMEESPEFNGWGKPLMRKGGKVRGKKG